MGYNNAREMNRFTKEQERLAEEYAKAGMSEEAIAAMYAQDWKWFCQCRVYAKHNVHLPEAECANERSYTPLIREYAKMSVTPSFEDDLEHFDWLDTIENEALYKGLCALADADLELLKLVFLDGYTQKEAAKKLSFSESKVSRHMKKILKTLGDLQL